MRNQPRNVVGDEQMWAGMIPGLGLMNYLLGLFTVPIECFLRRNFGERYFTRMNFLGGLGVLVAFNIFSHLMGGVLNMFSSKGDKTSSWMGTVIFVYVLLGIGHFLRIWWNDIVMGEPEHSYSSGRSWLRPIGRAVMFLLNLVLNNLVRLIFKITPKADEDRLPSVLPVLRDVDTFTERFIEPTVIFYLAIRSFGAGQTAIGWWLIFSVMALNLYTGLRHEAERGTFLDYRDQMIDARFYRLFLAGEPTQAIGSKERMVRETAREVEKNPDVLPIIEVQNPSLARAIERISPKLKAIAEQGEEQQAA